MRLNVTMNSLCDEPNPLGDEILFFSSDGTESYRKMIEAESYRKREREMVEAGRVTVEGERSGSDSSLPTSTSTSSPSSSSSSPSSPSSSSVDTIDTSSNNTMNVRQQQKYLLSYIKEADELANDAADRLRMEYKIGKYSIFNCYFLLLLYKIGKCYLFLI